MQTSVFKAPSSALQSRFFSLGTSRSRAWRRCVLIRVSYVLGQIPSNMIIGLVRPSIYLPACAILWSGVSAATAGVTSYQGLLAVRFFLGVVEAPLFPGVSYTNLL